jgi:endoglucanase
MTLRPAGITTGTPRSLLRARWKAFCGPVALFALAACSDSPVDPGIEPSAGTLSATAAVQAVSPLAGATLQGSVPFRASIAGMAPRDYKMYWQVDGGALGAMQDAASYDEAYVDVSSWKWNGTGPYAVTFIARDRKNRTIGQTTVNVYVTQPVVTTTPTLGNPLSGASFYVDPYSNAKKTADSWRSTRPDDAAQMDKIAKNSQADWLGGWNSNIFDAANARATTVTNAGALPVFVAYNIPFRDCGGYSSGGATSADAYRTWIRGLADGIGTRRAVVILEPDALAAMSCLSVADQDVRVSLIKDAVAVLKAKGNIAVYIDAGHPNWISSSEMGARLTRAGIAQADGFALNISNYYAVSPNATYGEAISAAVGGKHFLIDTSRNGLGSNGEWCNATGRALGAAASTATNHPLVDAFLWIKRPGESDGTCNGGPSAGAWWADYALGLAQRSTLSGALMASN